MAIVGSIAGLSKTSSRNKRWRSKLELLAAKPVYKPEGNAEFAEFMVKRQGQRIV